jgi:hypothetical protein
MAFFVIYQWNMNKIIRYHRSLFEHIMKQERSVKIIEILRNKSNPLNLSQLGLYNKMRMLWEEHVMWTRLFIISSAANLEDINQVTNRLLRNPADFESALQAYYGKEKSARFAGLLRDHLQIAAQLVGAAKAGDKPAADKYKKDWYDNADKIASYLASINPYWSEKALKNMLYEHLALTEAEALARLHGDYSEDILLYDEIEQQALMMADAFAAGIIKQFSESFK